MTDPTNTVLIGEDKAGVRLDRALAAAVPAVSRSRLKELIERGQVCARDGGAVVDPARRVRTGETYLIACPPPAAATLTAERRPLTVVFEDEHVIVVDKPAGLVVHPGAGNPTGTLVHALLGHCPEGLSAIGAPGRPGIVHRLDKDTSGVMVVAKTDRAHLGLVRQFASHSVERAYVAVAWGTPSPTEGRITGNIGRDPRQRKRMAVVAEGGKPAATRYRTLHPFASGISLVECRPETGRTHQIRVHLAAAGHAIVGDALYGGRRRWHAAARHLAAAGQLPARHLLHAFLIGFLHPITGEFLRYQVPLSCDIRALVDFLKRV